MKDKLDYLVSDLDFHISLGKAPLEVLLAVIEDYTYVYHSKGDGKTILNRAAEVALKQLRATGGDQSNND